MARAMAPHLAPRAPKTPPRQPCTPCLTCDDVRPLGFEPRTCGLRVLALPSFSSATHGLSCPLVILFGVEEASLGRRWRELLPK
jgi:hypothetical protein